MCLNISFGDDELVEADECFVVTFMPVNELDGFVDNENTVNGTIIDDESEFATAHAFKHTCPACVAVLKLSSLR